MEQVLIIVFVVVIAALVGLIMLQQGKGADAGASFGAGASQTVFGSSGSGNFMSRTTTILAFVFFAISLGLAYIAKEKASVSAVDVPAVIQQDEMIPGDDVPVSEETDQSVPEVPEQ